MRMVLPRVALIAFPLISLLLFGGCTAHQRLHHDLAGLHEEFHEYPHTRAEHERFHEDLDALHNDAHEQGWYRDRYYGRGPTYGYDGGRYWNGY